MCVCVCVCVCVQFSFCFIWTTCVNPVPENKRTHTNLPNYY